MSENKEKNDGKPGSENQGDFPTLSGMELPEELGTKIGPYKLLSVLGEGGFGIVYRAEQKEPVRRQVALKVIKPGMDSKQVIARFEAERQALVLLDHPNIARVFDAGTTESRRPYFVMEYVKGTPITEYCDRNKLNIEERLRLFIQVCEAIQHAHQKGIIHRDIKPSNILVSKQEDKVVSKVIDFGVAKAIHQPLTERTLFTEEGQLIGTPEYMSPEQAELTKEDIDTRSDIYSLGALLYELLTGTLPFDPKTLHEAAFDEILRIIRDEDPPRPSTRLLDMGEEATSAAASRRTDVRTLAKRLNKELEWIPLMALRKERDRRYKTASDLAEDIQNYLNGDTLLAGPESRMYRLQKAVNRNRVMVTAVAVVLIVLAGGVAASLLFALKAIDERDQKDTALTEVKEERDKAREAERFAEQALERESIAHRQAEKAKIDERKQRRLAERSSYFNRINLADKYYWESNIRRVRELLNSCYVDQREWEWYYLWHISDRSRMTLRGHESLIRSVAVSPDSKRIVSGSSYGMIKVWDVESGINLMTFQGHRGGVASVGFSPDGKQIVSGGRGSASQDLGRNGKPIVLDDKYLTLKVWDAESGSNVKTLRGHRRGVTSVRFSPDGKRIVSGGYDNTLKVWDVNSGTELMTMKGHEDGVLSVAFSPDGRRIVSGSWDTTLKVWDANSGDELMTLRGHKIWVVSGEFSPDSKRIVSGSWDKTLKVWDANSGDELMTLRGHESWIQSVGFSPNGKWIISGSGDTTLKVWDANSGDELMTLRGHEGEVESVAFSADGKRIISGSKDKTLKVWDAESDIKLITLRGHEEGVVASVRFSPDGKRIISGGRGGASVWLSPHGKLIVLDDKHEPLRVWDAESGSNLMTILVLYNI